MNIEEFCQKHKLLSQVYDDIVAMKEEIKSKDEKITTLEGAIEKSGYKMSETEEGGYELVKDEGDIIAEDIGD